MSRIRPVHYRDLSRVFEKAGFRLVRQEGDHRVYVKEGCPRPVVIPCWKEVPVFIIKNNRRTSGISREAYLDLLDG